MCFANKHKTAQVFWAMMDEFQSVIIQDAAAMLLDLPDSAHHGLFQLPVFQSLTFIKFMNGMKHHLEESQALCDAQINQVLLGMHSRMDSIGSNLNYVMHKVDKHETQMEDVLMRSFISSGTML